MRKSQLLTLVAGGAAVGSVLFAMLVIKFLWAWIIGDLFPGAVSTGLVKGSITWLIAFKLTVCLGVALALIRAATRRGRRR